MIEDLDPARRQLMRDDPDLPAKMEAWAEDYERYAEETSRPPQWRPACQRQAASMRSVAEWLRTGTTPTAKPEPERQSA